MRKNDERPKTVGEREMGKRTRENELEEERKRAKD